MKSDQIDDYDLEKIMSENEPPVEIDSQLIEIE